MCAKWWVSVCYSTVVDLMVIPLAFSSGVLSISAYDLCLFSLFKDDATLVMAAVSVVLP